MWISTSNSSKKMMYQTLPTSQKLGMEKTGISLDNVDGSPDEAAHENGEDKVFNACHGGDGHKPSPEG